jgi:RNA polymerase sigma-70 factor (ECF subfamily)
MGDEREDWKGAADRAMDRYARGDDGAFEPLYDLLAPRLHTFLLRRTRDPARAQDLVQQTFLQMHAARRHFSPGAAVMPWAFAIARRLIIDGLRKGNRECLSDDSIETEQESRTSEPGRMEARDSMPDSIVAKRRLAKRVDEELAHVPHAHRAAFELVQYDGLTMAEAAQVLGVTVAAVKLRAFRTYEVLRERLGDAVREEFGGAS